MSFIQAELRSDQEDSSFLTKNSSLSLQALPPVLKDDFEGSLELSSYCATALESCRPTSLPSSAHSNFPFQG
jgi:hypothetical protein